LLLNDSWVLVSKRGAKKRHRLIRAFAVELFQAYSSGPKLFKQTLFNGAEKDAACNRLTAFVEITVNCPGCSNGAFSRRPEAAAYPFDFLFGHVTSALAN
jgi:hypothetical protein